ncbi:MAG TPA: magnesium transporter [Deltaproteobacteria bacterium]|nr:magnesium transporter [Deltaproteobacteria bacterium]HCP47841.1 magnesium transporter [Deltaproteobacteria bacterium]
MPKDRQQLLVGSLRRLVRRGAKTHLRRVLDKARSEDIAEALEGFLSAEARTVFHMLLEEPERAAEVASNFDHQRLEQLFQGLRPEQLKPVFDFLASDDAADIMAALSEEMRQGILDVLADEESEDIEELMQYSADTAGGIMTTDFFALDKEMTAREAIVALQENPDAELVFYVYCINEDGTLVGVISLRQLLLIPPATQLKVAMSSEVISVPVTMDQEQVAAIVARYDLLALPVIDDFNKLVGIATVDDVLDVLRDEATEDMMLMAGVGDEDIGARSTLRSVRVRLPWLLAAVAGGLGAAFLIGTFEDQLQKVAILAAFIPIVMGLGGNVGVQASTIVVRGLAMEQLDPHNFLTALLSELKVVLFTAGVCALLVCGAAMVMPGGYWQLAAGVSCSLFAVMVFGAFLGTSVPMFSHRLGIDPAVATGPILTTCIDLFGVLIYFMISMAWLEKA